MVHCRYEVAPRSDSEDSGSDEEEEEEEVQITVSTSSHQNGPLEILANGFLTSLFLFVRRRKRSSLSPHQLRLRRRSLTLTVKKYLKWTSGTSSSKILLAINWLLITLKMTAQVMMK